MRWAIILLILLGVLAAASAALLVASYGGAGKTPTHLNILIATQALPAHTVLDDNMLALKTVTRREAPAKHYTNAVQVVGKMLIVPVAEGQVLTPECFGDRESSAKFAAAIGAGMVAVSITPKDYSSLEGLLYPGCTVDVIFTLKPSGNQEPVSKTLLQGVNVLAIGQYSVVSSQHEADSLAAAPSGEGQKVTLQLTPRQANKLQLALNNGSVSLALRHPASPATPDGGTISMDELLGKKKARVSSTSPGSIPGDFPSEEEDLPPGWEMLLIQGGVRETRSFPLPAPK